MNNKKAEVVEIIRGIAACSVALFHFSCLERTELQRVLHEVGFLGVDAFFCYFGIRDSDVPTECFV